MRFTVLKLACAAVCFTATAAEPITLTRFVMHFVDGQSALEYNERRRRDDHTVESKASIHVNFLADDTEYDFDLALLPSAFTRRATLRGAPRNGSFALASDFEPPSYGGTDTKNTKAVFTLGTNGFMAGTVFTANGTLSVTRGAGAGAHDLQGATHTWSEEVHEGCGMGVEKEEEHVSGGERRKREFDRWWGDGECYANDETTWALNTGIAVGYNMWVEMGESIAAVTEQIATIIQTTNVVYRGQLNLALKVDELHISHRIGDLPMDASRGVYTDSNYGPDIGCSKNIASQLHSLRAWSPNDQAVWHYFDNCRPDPSPAGTTRKKYTAGLAYFSTMCSNANGQNAGATYTSPNGPSSTWITFAHEVAHNLGAPHPFQNDRSLKGTFGGLMDYNDRTALQSDGTQMLAFNTDTTRDHICAHVDSKIWSSACSGHVGADAGCDMCSGVCRNETCYAFESTGCFNLQFWDDFKEVEAGRVPGAVCSPAATTDVDARGCEVRCSDPDGACSTDYSDRVFVGRPVTWLADGTPCLHSNDVWGTCQATEAGIACTVVECGNNYVDAAEECECPGATTSCAGCSDCQIVPLLREPAPNAAATSSGGSSEAFRNVSAYTETDHNSASTTVTTISARAAAGSTTLALDDITGIAIDDVLTISDETHSETSTVTDVTADSMRRRSTAGTVTLADALESTYASATTATFTRPPPTAAPVAAPVAPPTAPPTPAHAVCAAIPNARSCRTAGCEWTRSGSAKFKSCGGSRPSAVAVVAVDSVCKSLNAARQPARKCRSNAGCVWAKVGENKHKSCNGIANVPADLGDSAAVDSSICGSMTKYGQCRRNVQCRWFKTGIEKFKTCQPVGVAASTSTAAPTPAPPPPFVRAGVCSAWEHYDGCCRRDYVDPLLDARLLVAVEVLLRINATEANAVCATKCCAHGDCTAYELIRKKASRVLPLRFRCELHADTTINSASQATKSCKDARCEVLSGQPAEHRG